MSAGQWDRRGTCSALADSQIHKAAGIGVSRKNIGTKITKRLIPRNPQAPSEIATPAALFPTEEEKYGEEQNMARN
ncbi:hypothetical protein NKI71_13970 [Mesorhizobium sp. M0510]|uniref:hypothetical protein n=1 Tax=Mesorhizobium sp. M0510 TaxID=2956954 RepID=UPI00333D398D